MKDQLPRKVVALAIGAAGAVYFLQGSGLFTIYSSFMNNDIRWAIAGIAMVIVALVLWPKNK
jgi:hypothetical protein